MLPTQTTGILDALVKSAGSNYTSECRRFVSYLRENGIHDALEGAVSYCEALHQNGCRAAIKYALRRYFAVPCAVDPVRKAALEDRLSHLPRKKAQKHVDASKTVTRDEFQRLLELGPLFDVKATLLLELLGKTACAYPRPWAYGTPTFCPVRSPCSAWSGREARKAWSTGLVNSFAESRIPSATRCGCSATTAGTTPRKA